MTRLLRLLAALLLAVGLQALAYVISSMDAQTGNGADPVAQQLAANMLSVVVLLVTPAFILFVLHKPTGVPASGWREFWSSAWLAFLVQRNWSAWRLFLGTPTAASELLAIVDIAVAVWWGIDAVLSWVARPDRTVIRVERGLLHLLLFLGLAWSSIFRDHGVVRFLGVLMVCAVLLATAARIVLRRFDPHSLSGRLFVAGFRLLNRHVRWDGFPTWLAVINLAALREDLRAQNLHNTATIPVTRPGGLAPDPNFDSKYYGEREPDGNFNDLDQASMGRASLNPANPVDSLNFTQSHPSARFGRNVPLAEAYPDGHHLLCPNPREISKHLLARRDFIPAKTLNLLVAAWIQFQTHDWFNHGEPILGNEIQVPVDDDWHERPMRVRRTRPDPTRDYDEEQRQAGAPAARDYASDYRPRRGLPPPQTYANSESHWWDASQIYGSDPQTTQRMRQNAQGQVLSHGQLAVAGDRLIPDPHHQLNARTGFTGNWWAGLSLLHTLFVLEHNAICRRLHSHYPAWSGDQIFAVARMVNAALMAKIHTVEWTPAILGHPALQIAMDANWWGLLSERLHKAWGRLSENEAFGGIPGSGVDHHGADYCLTEEFVSVYRMHPLMPDELRVLSVGTGQELARFQFPDGVVGPEGTLHVFGAGRTVADVMYSFGRAHPGAITLHNFPNYLRKLVRPDGEIIDLAAIDVLRDRERGVPRYNRFRRQLRLPPIRSFDDFQNPLHPNLGKELRMVYGADADDRDRVDMLDLMVGMFAEKPPEGFGFSDTAFRIFILMASRRLKSDRFIAQDFTPDVYTPEGIDWVNDNTMGSVLLRHYPELRPALRGLANVFQPWNRL
jgi:hypothetical protein